MGFLSQLFGSGDFQPHGYCYLWNSGLVWLHVVSDGLIALAYLAIPVSLFRLARKRRDLSISWMFVLFGVFIVSCGATHAMEIWNLWHANYWLGGAIKAVTAIASIGTAYFLAPLMPKVLSLPSYADWIQANAKLEEEIRERRELELNLRINESIYREHAELLDLTRDAIFVCNLESRISYWNQAAEQLYDWRKEDTRGKVSYELLKTRFPKPLAEVKSELFRDGIWEGELVHQRRDGSEIIISSRWALRTDAAGKPVGIIESNRDITQRKREEEKFRNLLESAPDAMVIVNRAGQIEIVNAQTEKMFGYTRQELLGQAVEILVPKRFRDHHISHRDTFSSAPRTREMGAGLELLGRRKDGTEFPVEVSLSPLKAGEGTLISSAIRDVTDRKSAEELLRDTESRLALALDSVKIGAWDWDLTTDISIRSLRHDEIFGYATLLPKWGKEIFLTHVFPEDLEPVNRCIADSFNTGHLNMECRIVWPDKSIHWISVQGRVYRAEKGVPTRMRGVIADITDRRDAEQALERHRSELARSNAQLSALNKELETFSYSVSHDLRAPLRHIDGFARILQEEYAGELGPEGRRYLDRVVQAVNHMGHLIDDLLNLARIGRKGLEPRRADLSEIVREAIQNLVKVDDNRQIEWHIEPLPEVECDPGLLKLVLSNLLSNAVKFSRDRRPAVVEVGSRSGEEGTIYFVRDNGVGFDPQYADKLFGVFQRLHRQDEFEGTGIGLATVQRIIHRHGGEVWPESQPGKGATFYFTLGPRAGVPCAAEPVGVQHDRD